MSADERHELLDRYRQGERAFQLAKAFSLDRRTVADIVKRAGIRRPWAMTTEERAEAVRLYEEGWPCQRIGDHLNRDDETVRQAITKAGVRIREPWERSE